MKLLLKKLFLKRKEEADLNKDSINAANFYIKNKLQGAPLIEKTNATNYVAHGFYMGYRKLEEELGVKNGK